MGPAETGILRLVRLSGGGSDSVRRIRASLCETPRPTDVPAASVVERLLDNGQFKPSERSQRPGSRPLDTDFRHLYISPVLTPYPLVWRGGMVTETIIYSTVIRGNARVGETPQTQGRLGPTQQHGESRSPPKGVLSWILTFDATNVLLDGTFD